MPWRSRLGVKHIVPAASHFPQLKASVLTKFTSMNWKTFMKKNIRHKGEKRTVFAYE